MAESNAAADFYESPQYLSTIEAVPRMFAAAFPKAELLWFRALRPELQGYANRSHKIVYQGRVDDLLECGLLLPEMIQPGRRKLWSVDLPGGDSDEARAERFWITQRRAKKRVEVMVENVPGPLPALAPFGPDHWPFFDSPRAAREYCRRQMQDSAKFIDAVTQGVASNGAEVCIRQFGFAYAKEDLQAMGELTAQYRREMRELILGARIEAIEGPSLRVVGAR